MPPLQQPFNSAQPDNRIYPLWDEAVLENPGFVDATPQSVSGFTMMPPPPGQYQPNAPSTSTALTRRQPNHALVPASGRSQLDTNPESWSQSFLNDATNFLQPSSGIPDEGSIEELEKRALAAKRDAMNKRKQIPPFVQKLSSFLDEDRNTDLIRWSEKGDSFIVLDEDEFAKTLIPELFKHNNYASFVRQLNMYGFHKRVGLSDNSMRSSEKKFKSPSEYSNPYFRRGHPNLLWLINKARNSGNKKKTKKGDAEDGSDEDGAEDVFSGAGVVNSQVGRPPAGSTEGGPLQRKDLIQVKSEIERLQQNQVAINNMITKMHQDQRALFSQAVMFQEAHKRHENSIAAILNFLANVFRKSLEEQGGAQSVQELLSNILPNGAQSHNPPQMSQGNIVDFGDFLNRQGRDVNNSIATPKRQQRLLPPTVHQVSNATTLSPASTASPAPPKAYQVPQMGTVTELLDASPAESSHTSYMSDELRNNPTKGMMKIIQDTNAVNTSGIDLPTLAAKSTPSMNTEQRDQLISMMASQPNPQSPSMSSPTPSVTVASTPGLHSSGLSLSPILASIPPPNLHEYQAVQSEIENLQRMTESQQGTINHLNSMLGPLSPSGRIPGLDLDGNPAGGYFNNAGNVSPFNVNDFINENAFGEPAFNNDFGVNDGAGRADANDFSFALDDTAAELGGSYASAAGVVPNGTGFDTGSASTAATPSEAGTEEIPRNDLFFESPERDSKRRRKA